MEFCASVPELCFPPGLLGRETALGALSGGAFCWVLRPLSQLWSGLWAAGMNLLKHRGRAGCELIASCSQVKSGGAIEPQGTRITLRITDPSDMTRDILKVQCPGYLPCPPGGSGGSALPVWAHRGLPSAVRDVQRGDPRAGV